MKNSYMDIDLILENCVELPKVTKNKDPILDVKYVVDKIEVNCNEQILDITANLFINTTYKAVDHTLRWNEQLLPISVSKVLHNKVICTDCECIDIKKIGHLMKDNIFCQHIFVCFRMFYTVDFT